MVAQTLVHTHNPCMYIDKMQTDVWHVLCRSLYTAAGGLWIAISVQIFGLVGVTKAGEDYIISLYRCIDIWSVALSAYVLPLISHLPYRQDYVHA